MSAEKVIEYYNNAIPRKVWEMDAGTLKQAMQMCDDEKVYFWTPEPNYPDMPGRFFGIQVSIAKEKCCQIRFIFNDGHSHVVAPPMDCLSGDDTQ